MTHTSTDTSSSDYLCQDQVLTGVIYPGIDDMIAAGVPQAKEEIFSVKVTRA